ncbi:MAG: (Fe-S)-binding protein [Conexivisphaerales archaeon]
MSVTNSVLFYSVYAADVAVIMFFLVALLKEAKRIEVPVNFQYMLRLIREEIFRLRKGLVAYLHLSIFGAVGLSILFMIIYPILFLSIWIYYIITIISAILTIGLLAAVWWRIDILYKSRTIHKELGAELKLDKRFVSSSFLFQVTLIAVILLTMLDLDLIAVPFRNFFYYSSGIFIIRTVVVALLYVKPAMNTYSNLGRNITELTLPFNLKDVMDGKIDPSGIRLGAEKISDLQQFEINSFEACVEIGACEAACPATAVRRPLSPRALVRKLAIQQAKQGTDGYIFESISEEELWACTTCGACVYSCPVDVKHVPIIMDMRRKLVEQGKIDKKKSTLLLSIAQYNNSLGSPNEGRNSWLIDLGLRTPAQNPTFKYLFWVGCMGSFDGRIKKTIRDFISILDRAGVLQEFAILGEEEGCCGDPARRIGEESKFQELALKNIEIFKKYNVREIVLICPHGVNTFANEYPKLDSWMQGVSVVHHSQYIESLLKEGKIKIGKEDEDFVIHDPCYLSRYNGIVEPQRSVIGSIGRIEEPKLHGEKTFCCGAGGANYWYEVKEKRRISHERLDQLLITGSKNIVTLCPFCNAMLSDAVTVKAKSEVSVKDISEVVHEALK